MNLPEEKEAIERIYPQCVNISIDYGVMEKADNVFVLAADIGWSDLGTWGSAYENLPKDYLENAVAGDNVVVIDATKNMVHADNKKLVLIAPATETESALKSFAAFLNIDEDVMD